MPLRRRSGPLALAVLALPAAALFGACADTSDDAPPGPKADAGSIELPPEGTTTQRGRVIVARSEAPLEGATVAVGETTTTTRADGTYEIAVPRGTPYAMVVSAAEHYKLLEEEWSVTGPVDRGDTNLLSNTLAGLLAGMLPNRDPNKGVLAVRVYGVRGCEGEGGATLALSPPGAAQIRYFAGGLPSASATSVTAGESISAVFYDVDVNVPIRIEAISPTCAALPRPVTEGGVTYTGVVRTEPGETLSYARVFLGPANGAPDGGS